MDGWMADGCIAISAFCQSLSQRFLAETAVSGNLANLESWNLGLLESWIPGILATGGVGFLESWNQGIFESWIPGMPRVTGDPSL